MEEFYPMEGAELGQRGEFALLLVSPQKAWTAKMEERFARALAEGWATTFAAPDGRGALHCACSGGREDLAARLLEAGATVDDPCVAGGMTPLMFACHSGKAGCARLMLAAGADPNGGGKSGTALRCACTSGFADCARALLEAGARVDDLDTYGRSALAYLCMSGGGGGRPKDRQCARLLLEAGADPRRRDQLGSSPLDMACLAQSWGSAIELARAGADLDALSPQGTTALEEAASAGALEFVDALLAAGASLDGPPGARGADPARLAREGGHESVARAIEAERSRRVACELEGVAAPAAARPGRARL